MRRTRVKICGITKPEDAIAAVEAGADAIGLVFWPGSPRFVQLNRANEIRIALPPSVAVVGVFADSTIDDVRRAVDEVGINAAQLCGRLERGNWASLPHSLRILRAISMSGDAAIDQSMRIPDVGDYLLDSGSQGQYGGTGRTFDWRRADQVRSWGRLWLAGGLNSHNVHEAICVARPHAVDVSSGVESSPGIKSPELIHAFIDAVHHADHARAREGHDVG
jgi:phosphoribosylanthranilate isomerase